MACGERGRRILVLCTRTSISVWRRRGSSALGYRRVQAITSLLTLDMWALCIKEQKDAVCTPLACDHKSIINVNPLVKVVVILLDKQFSFTFAENNKLLGCIYSISGVFPDGAGRVATFLLSPPKASNSTL